MDIGHHLAVTDSLRMVATIKALRVSTAQMQRDLQEARETVRKARRLSDTLPTARYRQFLLSERQP